MFNEALPPVIAIAVLAIFFVGALVADIRNIRGSAPLIEAPSPAAEAELDPGEINEMA
jgi:hypothetical protein